MGNDFKSIPEFLKGGGEAGALIRSGTWNKTLSANYNEWPACLQFTLSFLLNAATPMFFLWESDHILFYNDPIIPIFQLNGLHPVAFGKNAKDVWREQWDQIKLELDSAKSGLSSSLPPDIFKHKVPGSGDTISDYQLNPIKDEQGIIRGILVIAIVATPLGKPLTHPHANELESEITRLLNSVAEGFYSRDIINDRYISLSGGCPKIYGYTVEEFLSRPSLWADVIHPDDKERVFQDDIDLSAGNQTLTEYRIFHKNGSLRWIEVKAIPVLKDGVLVRVDGSVNDITARKLAELETIKQKELSESIINSLPGIFYFYDKTGSFIRWNKNFELVSGYNSGEILTMHPMDFFPQDEKQRVGLNVAKVFETGEGDIEANFFTKDGRKLPYFLTGRTILYEDRQCLLGTGIDISKRTEIEEILQKNEAMLSSILNAIPQAIFWKDTQSNYLGCNVVFAKAAGVEDPSAIVGKNDFDLPWSDEEKQKYLNDDKEVMSKNLTKTHLIETQTQADGTTLWLDTTKIPLTDSMGKVYGILGIYEDITERKKDEEERERMTLDLIEKNTNLKQFSYIVSHNLRSPINKILGLGSLIKMPPHDDEQNYRIVEYIINEARSLDNVVKDLTTIISFQDLGISVKEHVTISEEVDQIQKSLDNEIQEANAEISCDFSAVNEIQTIKGYFYSILYNLITNAIKYRSPERPLHIGIKSSLKNGFICVTVSDNGLGIDLKRHRYELFGLYTRFHSREIPGKGLGLNLVKTQAETLGGKVEVESEPGLGSAFTVYFTRE